MSEPCIIEARDVTMRFTGFLAVNRVSLTVRQGTIHALIGPNGAGKTTLFNLISKFLTPHRAASSTRAGTSRRNGRPALPSRGSADRFRSRPSFCQRRIKDASAGRSKDASGEVAERAGAFSVGRAQAWLVSAD